MMRLSQLLFSLIFMSAAFNAKAQGDVCRFSDVLLVVDRSISMRGQIDGQRKWDITRDAVGSVLESYGDLANFGLMIYPGPNGLGAQGIEGEVRACRENLMEAMCTPKHHTAHGRSGC